MARTGPDDAACSAIELWLVVEALEDIPAVLEVREATAEVRRLLSERIEALGIDIEDLLVTIRSLDLEAARGDPNWPRTRSDREPYT